MSGQTTESRKLFKQLGAYASHIKQKKTQKLEYLVKNFKKT